MNRMQYVNEGGTNKLLAQYSWDALSRTQSIAYGDGTSDAYSQYDAGDNLQTLTQTYNGSNSSVTFNYTWLMNHQLNSAGVNNPLFQYVPQAGTVSYGTANADNGLTTVGGASMTYDGNENLTYDGYNTLSYDVENRMVQAENAAWGTSSYLYDPLGERKQKVVGVNTATPVATDFVLAGGEEIADYYETSATWRLTVRGAGGLPLVTVVPTAGGGSEEIVYVHHDMKGSTVALTEPGGSGPAETYTYSDYGQPQSGTWLAYQYAGYRYDSETGLNYMPARSYSPALGRFLQADPTGFGGGFNLYAYAGNDPVNLKDSTGLTPDGGGIAITLSETIATWFGGMFGVPSFTVAATAKVNTYSIYVSHGNLQLIDPSGNTVGDWGCTTGLNGDTNPADRNTGPLPPGTYTLDPGEISKAGFGRRVIDRRDWGDYRVPLHPVDGTDTYGRSGFFLHGGWKRMGSEGCIKVYDLNQDELFQTLIQVPGPVVLTDR
jgi:RHS repeat-associated protein